MARAVAVIAASPVPPAFVRGAAARCCEAAARGCGATAHGGGGTAHGNGAAN